MASEFQIFGRPGERVALAGLCVIAPVLVYLLIFSILGGGYFFPQDIAHKTLSLELRPAEPTLFVAEFAGRLRILLSLGALAVFALCLVAYAGALLYSRRGRNWMMILMGVAAGYGIAGALNRGNAMLDAILITPLEQAIAADPGFGLARFFEGADMLQAAATLFSLTAAAALAICFADFAFGYRSGDEREGDLRPVRDHLSRVFVASSALMTLATIATYYYYHFTPLLMTEASADIYRPLAASASLHWGASYTLCLAAASAPAGAAYLLMRSRALRAGTMKDDVALFPDTFSAKAFKAAGAVLTLLAPAIASPLFDMLGPLLS
ncbi:MAG: hypothetical protein AAF401_18690 [Pseudomonadota bacterium]